MNTESLRGILVRKNLLGGIKGCTGCNYETWNYETTPWCFYPGSPMAITLGQHYNAGGKATTLGQQYGVGERGHKKSKNRGNITPSNIALYGWQDNNVLTFFKSRCVLIFHHATPIGNFIHYCSVRVSLVRVRFRL